MVQIKNRKLVISLILIATLVLISGLFVLIANKLPVNPETKNTYEKLADGVMVFHLVWIVILLGGIYLSIRYEWYKPVHFVVLSSTILSQILFLGCPIVQLESSIRQKVGETNCMDGGFICHYSKQWLGITMSPDIITLSLVAIFILMIFTSLFVHKKKFGFK
jgi:cell division protein FtsW (lipid II flippase)